MTTPIRLLLAEDHAILRDGLRSLLTDQAGQFEVVAEADNGIDALRLAKATQPDLILLDIRMPLMNGTEAVGKLRNVCRKSKILIITQWKLDHYVRQTFSAGADGFFVKNDGMGELLNAIKSVMDDQKYISPSLMNEVLKGYLTGEPPPSPWTLLTDQERAIIKLIAEGKSSSDIGKLLHLGVRSIEKYRAQLMKKLGLYNTESLCEFAAEHHLV